MSKLIHSSWVPHIRVYSWRVVFIVTAYFMVYSRLIWRQIPERGLFWVIQTCSFVYSNRQVALNYVKSVTVALVLHIVPLIDRYCRSRHAEQTHLITSQISSTGLLLKLWQRHVLDFPVAAVLIGDTIFLAKMIECVGIIVGMCRGA